MVRLDKFLCAMKIGSRSQVKIYIKQGLVKVNGNIITLPETKVDETEDRVVFKGKELLYKKYVYYMLNKPEGVVSATEDKQCITVTGLLKDTGYSGLFPVGRLDKDTEGLLIMTNDGELAHHLLSPKKHVSKVYEVLLEKPLSKEAVKCIENGMDIGEDRLTLPASVLILDNRYIYLTITEGKFHQVKRMMQAAGNKVLHLKRVAMGGLTLDKSLQPGAYRELTQAELAILKES